MLGRYQPRSGQVVELDAVDDLYTMARGQAEPSHTILDRVKK